MLLAPRLYDCSKVKLVVKLLVILVVNLVVKLVKE